MDSGYVKLTLLLHRYTLDLSTEYSMYVEERLQVDDQVDWAKADNYKFWSSKKVVWPLLADVALTWGDIPVSSICAERAFAQARTIDTPLRQTQTIWSTFCTEVFLRVNGAALSRLLEKKLELLK